MPGALEKLKSQWKSDYSDMPFEQFVSKVHEKHYSDIPFDEFTDKLGLTVPPSVNVGAGVYPPPESTGKSLARKALIYTGGAIGGAITTPETLGMATLPGVIGGSAIGKEVGDLILGPEPLQPGPPPSDAPGVGTAMVRGALKMPWTLPNDVSGLAFPNEAVHSVVDPLVDALSGKRAAKDAFFSSGRGAGHTVKGFVESMAAPVGLMGEQAAKDAWEHSFAGSAAMTEGNIKLGQGVGRLGARAGRAGAVAAAKAAVRNNPEALERIRIAQEQGVPITLGEALDNRYIQGAETVMEKIPGLGMQKFREGQSNALKDAAERLTKSFEPVMGVPEDTGAALAEGVNRAYQQVKKEARKNYEEFERLSEETGAIADMSGMVDRTNRMTTDPESAASLPKDLVSEMRSSPITKDLFEPGADRNVTMKQARRIASWLNDKLRAYERQRINGSITDREFAGVTQLKEAVENAVKTSANEAGGEVRAAYDKAQAHYREEVGPYKDRQIRKVNSSVKGGEAVDGTAQNAFDTDTIVKMFVKGDRPKLAQKLFERLDATGKQDLRHAILKEAFDAGLNTANKEPFSPMKFRSVLEKLGSTKNSLFTSSELRHIEAFNKLMETTRRAGQYKENQATGARNWEQAAYGGGIVGAIMSPSILASAAPGYAITKIFQRLVTSQEGISLLEQAAKMKPGTAAWRGIVNRFKKFLSDERGEVGLDINAAAEQRRSLQDEGPRLTAQHNITPSGLRFADTIGGLPSPSIGVMPKGKVLSGFGDITLLGTKDVGSPSKKNPVFDADAYTTRQPRAQWKHKLNDPAAEGFFKKLKETGEKYDEDYGYERVQDSVMGGEKLNARSKLETSIEGMALFLEENGVDVPPVYDDTARSATKVDATQTSRALQDAIDQIGWGKYSDWVTEKIDALFEPTPYMDKGKKTAPYTLEEATKEMTKEKDQRGTENSWNSFGRRRAMMAKRFFDLEEMRSEAGKMISGEQDVVRDRRSAEKATNDFVNEVVLEADKDGKISSLSPSHRMEVLSKIENAAMDVIEEFGRGGNITMEDFSRRLKAMFPDQYKNSAPSDFLVQQGIGAYEAIRTARVPYFEAKPQRPVKLEEFKAAVIPKSAPPYVKDILNKRGIPFKEYEGELTREWAVKDMHEAYPDTLFDVTSVPQMIVDQVKKNGLKKTAIQVGIPVGSAAALYWYYKDNKGLEDGDKPSSSADVNALGKMFKDNPQALLGFLGFGLGIKNADVEGRFLRGGGKLKGGNVWDLFSKMNEEKPIAILPKDGVSSFEEAVAKAQNVGWMKPNVLTSKSQKLRYKADKETGMIGNEKMEYENPQYPKGRNTYDEYGCGRGEFCRLQGIAVEPCYGGACYAETQGISKGRSTIEGSRVVGQSKKGALYTSIKEMWEASGRDIEKVRALYPEFRIKYYEPEYFKTDGFHTVKGEKFEHKAGDLKKKENFSVALVTPARGARVFTKLQKAKGQDVRLGVDTDGSAWMADKRVLDSLNEAGMRTLTVYSAGYYEPPPPHPLSGRTVINVTVSGWHPLPETLARIEWARKARDNGWNVILREVVADPKSFPEVAPEYNRIHDIVQNSDFYSMQQPLHVGKKHGVAIGPDASIFPRCCKGTPDAPHTCKSCDVSEGLGLGFRDYWQKRGKRKFDDAPILPDIPDYREQQATYTKQQQPPAR